MESCDLTVKTRSKHSRKQFTPFEDQILMNVMASLPFVSWKKVASFLANRSPRQCRDRWVNYLDPNSQKREWSIYDDTELRRLVDIHGTKWSKILLFFPGTSYNFIKNRYYSGLSKHEIKNIDKKDTTNEISIPLFFNDDPIFKEETLIWNNH